MRSKILKLLLVSSLLLAITPSNSFCWIRDADIQKSCDSVSIGMLDYPFFAYAFEKRLDKDTSVGARYLPYYFGLYQNYDITWNEQFYRDEGSSWAYYWGIYNIGYPGIGMPFPVFGWAYKNKLSDKWDFRLATYLIIPTTVEFTYLISDSLEFSFGLDLAGTISLRYLF